MALFTNTAFEILLLEGRSALSPAQQSAGYKRFNQFLKQEKITAYE